MPVTHQSGRFIVMTAHLKPSKWHGIYARKNIALIELHDPEKVPRRIDPREKAIKRIIAIDFNVSLYACSGKIFKREYLRRVKMAERFDKLWPLHVLAKEWPYRGFQSEL